MAHKKNQPPSWRLKKGILLPNIIVILLMLVIISCVNDPVTPHWGESVTDIDGNVYKTVIIGNQTWMAENLKTTTLNDGTKIPFVQADTAWDTITIPAYWYYSDNFKNIYGLHYNYFAVQTGKLAPLGWHIPTDNDWKTLEKFLGQNAGGKLKETDTSHWLSPNTGATNETGFTALPGGCVLPGLYYGVGIDASWWSSTVIDYRDSTSRDVDYASGYLGKDHYSYKFGGFNARCIKD